MTRVLLALALLAASAIGQTPPHGRTSAQLHAALAGGQSSARTRSIPPALVPPLDQLQADGCAPSWVATFGSEPGLDVLVSHLLVWDDGNGPALYVSGAFSSASGLPGTDTFARWDGTNWSSVGGGPDDGGVGALAIYDDGLGGGPALYAAGGFTSIGGVAASQIAKWDGVTWSPLAGGLSSDPAPGSPWALAVFDDGNGAKLVAGGTFLFADGQLVRGIAQWDGLAWTSLGNGLTGNGQHIGALAVHDDGSGLALYAGGNFTQLDDTPFNRIARWDGRSWSDVGGGVGTGTNPEVRCLAVIDLGSGPYLYAGGSFTNAGGTPKHHIAAWDGANWRQLGTGISNGTSGALPWVAAITAYDDGNGLALYAGGRFAEAGGVAVNHLARWNGTSWSAVAGGVSGHSFPDVGALCVFDDGGPGGSRLYVGGDFASAGTVLANDIATWDGADWAPVATATDTGLNDTVLAAAVFDDGRGAGPALYVGGGFDAIGVVPYGYIAKWDGDSWSPLGSGLNGDVYTLTVFDDGLGGGPALYAGGSFTNTADAGPVLEHVARWDGASWQPLGIGADDIVWELRVYDDGSGPNLYAAGDFTIAGGVVDTQYVARWNGAAWSALSHPGIVGGEFIFTGELLIWGDTLEVFDDGHGGGPALYLGGLFKQAGGITVNRIAKWQGGVWSSLSTGSTSSLSFINDLEVYDDGGGPDLYVSGSFNMLGGVAADQLAQWNGTTFEQVGGFVPASGFMTTYDDGSGERLVVAGAFSLAEGGPGNRLAAWDGSSWSQLGDGVDDDAFVLCVQPREDGGNDLVVGGWFYTAGGNPDAHLARWTGCPVTPSPWHFLGYALAGTDGPPLLAGTGPLLTGSPGTLALSHANPSAFSVLFVSLGGVSAPFKCGTLVPVPVALQFALFTNGGGNLPLGWAAWPGGLSGLSLYFQFAVQDPAAGCGVALSNALRADVP